MKKKSKFKLFFCIAVASCLSISNIATSKKHSGGFKDSRTGDEMFEIVSVEQAKNAKDDTYVILQGYIDKSLGGEKYLFRDQTGTIKLDIDDDKFRGLTVYPDDFVQVSGEVDKDWWSETEIEVKNISKQTQNND